jgi:hypothetical protein
VPPCNTNIPAGCNGIAELIPFTEIGAVPVPNCPASLTTKLPLLIVIGPENVFPLFVNANPTPPVIVNPPVPVI